IVIELRRFMSKAQPKQTASRLPASSFIDVPQLSRNRKWFFVFLLFAATILAYQPAWTAGYIWDDDKYVTGNPLLSMPHGWQHIWFSPKDTPSQYFPLTYTALRIEHGLWGLNPAGYHWFNILLHAINALLVWQLLKRLSVPGAWLA